MSDASDHLWVPTAAATRHIEFSCPWLPAPNDLSSPIAGFQLTVHSPNLHATAWVSLSYEDREAQMLATFFQDLAEHWSGWEGERCSAFGDGRLLIAASHDGRRQVQLGITIIHPTDGWQLENFLLSLEPGSLATIATALDAFLRLADRSP